MQGAGPSIQLTPSTEHLYWLTPFGSPEELARHFPAGWALTLVMAWMPKSRWLLAGCLITLPAAIAFAQQLVPLTDPVEEPLLPTGIIKDDVELFGVLVYLWRDETETEVIHFVGDFELHLGSRRLKAREAVIWMTPRIHEGTPYHAFDVLLWRDARVTEPAGTVTSGPLLFVTLSSSGKVRLWADKKAMESSAHTPVYQEAVRARARALEARGPAETMPPFQVTEPGPLEEAGPPPVRPVVNYRARDLTVDQVEGRPVITAIGDVYLFRGAPEGGDFLELRADAAVVYLVREPDRPDKREEPPPVDLTQSRAGRDVGGRRALSDVVGEPEAESGAEEGGLGTDLLRSGQVEAVYLEGDIVMTLGERTIRASRLYYDLLKDRAVILDAVLRTHVEERGVPVYIRAERVRQLSSRQYVAEHPIITTSEFHSPHYHIGATNIELEDKTETQLAGLQKGTYEMTHTTFNVKGVPVLYWPYTRGTLKEGESPLRTMRTGYSDDFGFEMETSWHLFDVLGLETPPGFDARLQLDYFSERGPGVGVNMDYERDRYFGEFLSYYIHDTGDDNLGGRFRDEEPDTENRGRLTFRHRQYLPSDWQLTLEASYLSDENFLEEYFESEFDTGKAQETLFYLKKQRDNWAFTLQGQWRINDFLTQTERLPEATFRLYGESLGGVATLFSENRAGLVRFREADQEFDDFLRTLMDLDVPVPGMRTGSSGTTARADSRQELDVPLTLGPVKLVPFGSVRGTAWDDSPEDGGLTRFFGGGGIRGGMYLWRVYDVESALLDIHGVRHIIQPEIIAWGAGSTRDPNDLYIFDEGVEFINDADGASVAVNQRWQTKRGGPGRERITDVFTLDLEAGFFNDPSDFWLTDGFTSYSRPENSITRNYLSGRFAWRISDTTSLLSEANFDLNDGTLGVYNLSYVAERTPRLSYLVGYRYINETESSLLGAGVNYKLTEKHSIAVREVFDLDRGETEEFSVALIRRLPRWFVGLAFDLDEVEDDFGVSLSVWPEGFPRTVIGSRRFTGVATSTAISPE